jgi:hypothetical protein
MACDPNTLLDQAKCFQCIMSGDLLLSVEIVMLCAIRDGTFIDCDPQALISQATCIRACIPFGMLSAVKLSLLCQIASL